MKTIIILLTLAVTLSSQAQKQVIVYVQSPANDGKDLYYSMKYGLKTMLDQSELWQNADNDKYYSSTLDANMQIAVCNDDDWADSTIAFITHLTENNNTDLWVYVGHNYLLDTTLNVSYTDCTVNLLFGCMTDNWEGIVDNTLMSTSDFYSPEAYSVVTGIETWLVGDNEDSIRKKVAEEYAHYQNKTIDWSYRIHQYYE